MKLFYNHFKYTIHNLIAHPLMEILHLVGLSTLGNHVHNLTLPSDHGFDHKKPTLNMSLCPSCKSQEIVAINETGYDGGLGECFRTIACKSCKTRWDEIYTLTDQEIV
ncbi:hypothetical protein CMI37_08650 [Candidatus Pacearchaeota archaeon]|nr:hypothetical protein [Candidatus Pacearchaeota archaeon]